MFEMGTGSDSISLGLINEWYEPSNGLRYASDFLNIGSDDSQVSLSACKNLCVSSEECVAVHYCETGSGSSTGECWMGRNWTKFGVTPTCSNTSDAKRVWPKDSTAAGIADFTMGTPLNFHRPGQDVLLTDSMTTCAEYEFEFDIKPLFEEKNGNYESMFHFFHRLVWT